MKSICCRKIARDPSHHGYRVIRPVSRLRFGVAIEGTRSRTGGLLPGKTGAAYLANRANAPLVPMAIWGTEQIIGNLKRLRRSTIHIRIGPMVHLPEGRANTVQLEEYTDQLMLTIARALPPEYRGVYRERIKD